MTEASKDKDAQENSISLQESFYFDTIRELMADSSKSKALGSLDVIPGLSIDDILDRMEKLNGLLEELGGVQLNSIRSHVEYTMGKSRSFTDTRFECLFKVNPPRSSSAGGPKNAGRLLDYSFREKLIGFVPRRGKLLWDDGRISDFVESIAKSNRQ